MIVAINGGTQCGKDTVYKIWVCIEADLENEAIKILLAAPTWSPPVSQGIFFQKMMFAEKLKKLLAEMFDCKVEDFENEDFKNQLLPDEWQVWEVYEGERLKVTFPDEHSARMVAQTTSSYFTRTYRKSERTYRWALQYVGTDLLRVGFHPNAHVNMLMKRYKGHEEKAHPLTEGTWSEAYKHIKCASCGKGYAGYKRQSRCRECIDKQPYIYPNWFVTDLRFPNELEAIQRIEGSITMKIVRKWALRFPQYADMALTLNPYAVPDELKEVNPKLWKKLTHPSETSLEGYGFYHVIHNNEDLDHLINEVRWLYNQVTKPLTNV